MSKDPNVAYAATLSFGEIGPVVMKYLEQQGYISKELWDSWHAKRYSACFSSKDGELIFQVLKKKNE